MKTIKHIQHNQIVQKVIKKNNALQKLMVYIDLKSMIIFKNQLIMIY